MWRVCVKILIRGLSLFIVGYFYQNTVRFDFGELRFMGVLQHIGLAWMLAAFIYLIFANRIRTQVLICAFILVSYWLFVTLVPARDVCGPDAFTAKAFKARAAQLFTVRAPDKYAEIDEIIPEKKAPEAEQSGAETLTEKTKRIYKEMQSAHPWLTSENDLPFAALMAVSGTDADAVYAQAEEIYTILKKNLRADRDTLQMLSHVLAIRDGRAEAKCEKVCALAKGLKAARRSLGWGSRLAILGLLADSGLPTDALVERICETDAFLKKYKPFRGLFGVGGQCRRMFAVQMVHASLSREEGLGASAMMTASVELAIITMILMMIILTSTASSSSSASSVH